MGEEFEKRGSGLKIYAIIITIILAVSFIYLGLQKINRYFEGQCEKCSQEGFQDALNSTDCIQRGFDKTLQGIIDEVKKRGNAIEMKVGEESLICDIRR